MTSASAGVIHVDPTAPPGGNGATWQTALRHLSDALSIAAAGDEIRLATGVHRPDTSAAVPGGTGDRNAFFAIGGPMSLRGGFAGLGGADPNLNDPSIHLTILSGDLAENDGDGILDDNSERLISVPASSAGVVVIDGLTLAGANGLGALRIEATGVMVSRCRFIGNRSIAAGGAIFATKPLTLLHGSAFIANRSGSSGQGTGGVVYFEGAASSTSMSDCYFEGNISSHQGGAVCYGVSATAVTPEISDCVFIDNRGEPIGTVATFGKVKPTFRRCHFIAGQLAAGAQLSIYGGPAAILDCHFHGNASGAAGAFASFCVFNCVAADTTIIAGSRFTDNFGTFVGAATQLVNAASVSNSIFSSNIALGSPGVIEITNNSRHKTLDFITITGGLPNAMVGHQAVTVRNSILWDNGSSIAGLGAAFAYSLVEGGAPGGTAIISADPLFVAPDAHDLRLQIDSPAIDAGSAALIPPDVADQDGDGDLTEPLPVDHDGAPRVQGVAPDLGAFEGGFRVTAPTAEATAIDPGTTVVLEPDPNPALPSVVAILTNVDGPPGATASLAQVGWNPHPGAPGLTEEGLVGDLSTSIADGAHRTQIRVPITLATLWPDVDPGSVRLSIWDDEVNGWRLAVARNIGAAANGSGGPAGLFSLVLGAGGPPPPLSTELGDHGVYWDGVALAGFAFANVDRAGEFGVGRALCQADLDGDGVIDGTDLGVIIGAWGSAGGSADLDGNGLVDGADLAALIAEWGPCTAGLGDSNSSDAPGGAAGRLGALVPVVATSPEWFDPSRADLSRDGAVDGADLGLLLAEWGPAQRGRRPLADLDGDGAVNGADLGLLLGAWGG
ncbi:MAG TPA: choice-of-anchor Q domain-containing protein [Phycisphaerales bacterium]|nr:choice-of-anchor Q domain-containing protein [Phycisphaerales bacterium]HMP38255.1 choice-of-anchor Q domain-containing protein [Phycisphaerales bacterium]